MTVPNSFPVVTDGKASVIFGMARSGPYWTAVSKKKKNKYFLK